MTHTQLLWLIAILAFVGVILLTMTVLGICALHDRIGEMEHRRKEILNALPLPDDALIEAFVRARRNRPPLGRPTGFTDISGNKSNPPPPESHSG